MTSIREAAIRLRARGPVLGVAAILLASPLMVMTSQASRGAAGCARGHACAASSSLPRPGALRVARITDTQVELRWRRLSGGRRVDGFELFVNGRRRAFVRGSRFTVTGLACATRYRLSVRARGAHRRRSRPTTVFATTRACPPGKGSASSPAAGPASRDTSAPTAPGGVTVGLLTRSSITLSWTASTDNVRVAGYNLFGNGTLQPGRATSTAFTFTGLTCGTSYSLGVQAFDAAGNVSAISPASAATLACPDTTAPTPPKGLTVGKVSQSTIDLSWTASIDDVGVAGYNLSRDAAPLPDKATATSFTFAGLACGTPYSLGVQAIDAAGNRSPFVTTTATSAPCPPVPVGTCPADPLQGVQVPSNLTVLSPLPASPCRTAVGRVAFTSGEPDGDCHVHVTVDPQFTGLLSPGNTTAAHGNLITEIIPSHKFAGAGVGSRVEVFGTWVSDHQNNWNELHPVWTMKILAAGAPPAC